MNVNNTNVTIGVFDGDSLTATWRFATDVRKTGDEYGVLMSNLLTHDGVAPDDVDAAVMPSSAASCPTSSRCSRASASATST